MGYFCLNCAIPCAKAFFLNIHLVLELKKNTHRKDAKHAKVEFITPTAWQRCILPA
jgi:hypothetical protein